MTDDEIKELLREGHEGFPKGYYVQRERIPVGVRAEVDAWVKAKGGSVDAEWYRLPLSVAIQ